MQLDRVSQTFHEPPVVERLAQEVYRLAQGLDKLAHAVAGQFVIINDRDQWSFGHPYSPGRNVSQLGLQNHSSCLQNLT